MVTNLDDAHEQIDTAIATALRESKPVYLSISCNLPGLPHPTFSRDPVPFFLTPRYHLSRTDSQAAFFSGNVDSCFAWTMKLFHQTPPPPKPFRFATFYIYPTVVTFELNNCFCYSRST